MSGITLRYKPAGSKEGSTLKQKHWEAWSMAFHEETKGYNVENAMDLPIIVYRGCFIRAAAKAGWLEGVEPEDGDTVTDEMTVQEAQQLFEQIAELYNTTVINPN